MPSAWMIPRWSKRREDEAIVLEQTAHGVQDPGRLAVVLKSIDGDDDVHWFVDGRAKRTCVGDAGRSGCLPRYLKNLGADVDADDAPGAMLGEFNGARAHA